MDDDAATVLALEPSRLRALVEADLTTAEALHPPDYQLITPPCWRDQQGARF